MNNDFIKKYEQQLFGSCVDFTSNNRTHIGQKNGLLRRWQPHFLETRAAYAAGLFLSRALPLNDSGLICDRLVEELGGMPGDYKPVLAQFLAAGLVDVNAGAWVCSPAMDSWLENAAFEMGVIAGDLMENVGERLEHQLSPVLKSGQCNFAVWGLNAFAHPAHRILSAHGKRVVCFIDSDPDKQRQPFCGVEVLPLESALESRKSEIEFIIICSRHNAAEMAALVNGRIPIHILFQACPMHVSPPGPHHEILSVINPEDNSYSRRETFKALSLAVEYINGGSVDGDVAEFGTMSGQTALVLAMSMASLALPHSPKRNLHLFDSFQGFPEITTATDKITPDVSRGFWSAGACKGIDKHTLKRVCANAIPADRISIHDGWYNQTLPAIPRDTRFALIHIDCDLYQSTIEVLDHLFSNGMVSTGAAILFDDYNCNMASNEFGERKAWDEIVKQFEVRYSNSADYSWNGRKLIVQSYKNSR